MTVGEAKAGGYKLTKHQQKQADAWPADPVIGHEPKGGDYADGHFCGLRCGYLFGVAMADAGHQFDAIEDE